MTVGKQQYRLDIMVAMIMRRIAMVSTTIIGASMLRVGCQCFRCWAIAANAGNARYRMAWRSNCQLLALRSINMIISKVIRGVGVRICIAYIQRFHAIRVVRDSQCSWIGDVVE